jgi:hypothetical protein
MCGQLVEAAVSSRLPSVPDYMTPQLPFPGEINQTPAKSGSFNGYHPQQGPGYIQSARLLAPPQRPPQRRRVSGSLIALILALLLLLSSIGIWITFYATVTRPAQLRAQASTTALAAQNSESRETVTVVVQVSATANVQANATATARAKAQATATAQHDFYTQATGGEPELNLSLGSQSSANWDVYTAQGGGGCAFSNGALHASVSQPGHYVPCFAQNSRVNNFALEVQMTLIKGDNGGIIFRGDPKSTKSYFFLIGSDGSYKFLVSKTESSSSVLTSGKSSFIKAGTNQTNTITAIARNETIYIYVNQQFVTGVSDPIYSSGTIGVLAEDLKDPTEVAFSNLRVWKL